MSTPGGPPEPGDAARWAPFPVQDWSTMPEPYDPDAHRYVDPAWGPPVVPPRKPAPGPRWLPWLAVIMATVLVGVGLYAADHVGAATGSTAADRFLPVDGAVSYRRVETTVGDATTSSTLVQESARQSGALVIGGLDYSLSLAVGRVVGLDDLAAMSFWRTTGTKINNLGASQQDVGVYRVDGAVELVAESGPGGADVYRPALLELPAHVRAGDSWSGAGSVGARRYRSDFRATDAGGGCLQVTGTVVQSTTSGQPGSTRDLDRTWCPGRGIVAERTTQGEVRSQVLEVSRPAADPTLRTVDEDWTWSDPARWRRRDFDLMSADASLGSGAMAGSAALVAPVVTASGLVFRVTSGDDLVATTPKTVDRWTSVWRMHPGGTVLALAAFGDVLVATTSQRRLVGYSDAGVRLWEVGLDDVAWWAPTRVDERRVTIGDAAGGVRLVDLLTGGVSWRREVGAQVSAPLVATAGTVVALDAGGHTTAFDVVDGDQRWSREVPGNRAAVLGRTVVVRNQATLEGLDLQTGRHRWLLPRTGTLDALQPYGDVLLAATQLGTVAIDEQGTIVQQLPAYERVTVVGDVVVGWGRAQAEFRDRTWSVLATIDTPDTDLAHGLPPTLAYRQGVMMFGKGWTFTTWSDEP